MQGRKLAQQFLGALVLHHGGLDDHLDDLIAASVLAGIEDAALAQPKLLLVLRAGRDLEQRFSVDGRNLDLGSEAGFGDGNRHLQLNVVTFAAEQGMIFDVSGDVEIARGRSHASGVAFTGNSQSRATLRAGRDSYFDNLGMSEAAIAVARRADVLESAFAIAFRAGEVELHVARHLGYAAGGIALRTGHRPGLIASGAKAGGALV